MALLLSTRSNQRSSPALSPCVEGTSARLRRGVTSLFRRLRPGCHGSPRSPQATPPSNLIDPTVVDRPTPAISRYLAGRAAVVFEDVDDEMLLNHWGSWRMQLGGLEELNSHDEEALKALLGSLVRVEDKQWEAEELAADLEARHHSVTVLRLSLHLVEAELERRGVPLAKPEAENGLVDISDDADLCQYCVSQPADTEFGCCHHTGACLTCAALMMQDNPRCPHCRTSNPPVLHRDVGCNS